MLNNPYQKYQNNAIMTATPGELTLMLYNGAIKFINQGIDCINDKNIQKAHINIVKAQNIIEELRVTLDTKYEVAKEIQELYTFIKELLIQANIEKNTIKLEQARDLIREFRDIWQEVLKLAK